MGTISEELAAMATRLPGLLHQYRRLLEVTEGMSKGTIDPKRMVVDLSKDSWTCLEKLPEAKDGQDTEGLKNLADEAACLRRANAGLPERNGDGHCDG
jgi:hypothetical protein